MFPKLAFVVFILPCSIILVADCSHVRNQPVFIDEDGEYGIQKFDLDGRKYHFETGVEDSSSMFKSAEVAGDDAKRKAQEMFDLKKQSRLNKDAANTIIGNPTAGGSSMSTRLRNSDG